jgi:predicted transcriptional regulator
MKTRNAIYLSLYTGVGGGPFMDARETSKLLYGSAYRLEVAAAIATREVFSCRELARDLGVTDSLVRPELEKFEKAGLLERMPRTERIQYFMRRDNNYWKFCTLVYAEAVAGEVAAKTATATLDDVEAPL